MRESATAIPDARSAVASSLLPIAMGGHADPDGPVARVAREVGATPSRTAPAWLLHRAPHLVPVPGTSSAAHLLENLGALDVTLTEEQFARLGEEGGADAP